MGNFMKTSAIAYHKRYRVALLSSNLVGPSDNGIAEYLHSYLTSVSSVKFVILIMMIRPYNQKDVCGGRKEKKRMALKKELT